MQTTITSKGQITLPAKLRKKLNLKPGDRLEFDPDAPVLTAYRTFDRDKMRSILGRGKKKLGKKSSAELLEDLRGPVDLP